VLVEKAETALGGRFPPTYRKFVSQLGAGNFGSFEVYGVVDGEFRDAAIPNGIWLTLNERRESGLPSEFMIVGSTGDGAYYCVEIGIDQEAPVIVWEPGSPTYQQAVEVVASDFGEFFLSHIRPQS
jgi:antitoxin YobK